MPPDSGHHAALGEAGEELGRLGHQPHVRTEGQVEAVARRGAVDHRDHRGVHLLEHHGGQVAGLGERRRRATSSAAADAGAGHGVLDVEARAEPLAGAGEEHHAHVGAVVGLGEQLGEQLQHAARDGVAAVGPVQGDGGDVVGDLVEDLGPVALVRLSVSVGGGGGGGVSHRPTR